MFTNLMIINFHLIDIALLISVSPKREKVMPVFYIILNFENFGEKNKVLRF